MQLSELYFGGGVFMEKVCIALIGIIIGGVLGKVKYHKKHVNIVGLYIQLEQLRRKNKIKIIDDKGEELYGGKLKNRLQDVTNRNK